MGEPLNKDSFMECPRHGIQKPTFICQHLQHGTALGFHEPDNVTDDELPFRNAWCDQCDRILLQQGGWNDTSEAFANPRPICEGCYEVVRKRNQV